MARKVALITGITGQDGSYLAELLLSKVRREISTALEQVPRQDVSSECRLRRHWGSRVEEWKEKDGHAVCLWLDMVFWLVVSTLHP
mmetsp:Transcript_4870/g.17678  ORF Transcript_4870/g.17678 Transcript_4870/m.17678 type:complete len:86 (+) Transcript_4870:43-300(+)